MRKREIGLGGENKKKKQKMLRAIKMANLGAKTDKKTTDEGYYCYFSAKLHISTITTSL